MTKTTVIRYSIWASITLCFSACNWLSDASHSSEGNGDDGSDRAAISPELKTQLEAMGYPQPEKTRDGDASGQKNNPYANVDLAHFMEGMDATFVFLDVQRNIEVVHNPARAKTRFTPCSTFKIPNSLIALETGVMQSAQSEIKWDRKKYPKQPFWDDIQKNNGLNWETDHTLQSAFKNSCVWCYMEIAERIGTDAMQKYIDRFAYGNRDISSGEWPFWINSSLQISAREQVAFLKRLVQQDLGLSSKTFNEGEHTFRREQAGTSVLYAKTGTGSNIGWFVGFVEEKEKYYVFAFNMAGDFNEIAAKRITVAMNSLRELGVWP